MSDTRFVKLHILRNTYDWQPGGDVMVATRDVRLVWGGLESTYVELTNGVYLVKGTVEEVLKAIAEAEGTPSRQSIHDAPNRKALLDAEYLLLDAADTEELSGDAAFGARLRIVADWLERVAEGRG